MIEIPLDIAKLLLDLKYVEDEIHIALDELHQVVGKIEEDFRNKIEES